MESPWWKMNIASVFIQVKVKHKSCLLFYINKRTEIVPEVAIVWSFQPSSTIRVALHPA